MIDHPLNRPGIANRVARTKALIPCDALTLLAFIENGNKAIRLYTEMPRVFPLSGIKDIPQGPLRDCLTRSLEPQLFQGSEEITAMFWDYKTILENGVQALLNIPLTDETGLIGTVNCLFQHKNIPANVKQLYAPVYKIWSAGDFTR